MKKFLATLCIVGLLSGCTERTEFGECIGVQEDKDPSLVYRVSKWNVAMAIIFFGTAFVPIIVGFWELSCPVAKKPTYKGDVK